MGCRASPAVRLASLRRRRALSPARRRAAERAAHLVRPAHPKVAAATRLQAVVRRAAASAHPAALPRGQQPLNLARSACRWHVEGEKPPVVPPTDAESVHQVLLHLHILDTALVYGAR